MEKIRLAEPDSGAAGVRGHPISGFPGSVDALRGPSKGDSTSAPRPRYFGQREKIAKPFGPAVPGGIATKRPRGAKTSSSSGDSLRACARLIVKPAPPPQKNARPRRRQRPSRRS
jgi:hypothetical protein